MKKYQSDRMILAQHPGWSAVSDVMHENGWNVIEEIPAGNPRNSPREIVIEVGPPTLEVHYCEDGITQNSFVFAVAATESGLNFLVAALESSLETVPLILIMEGFDRGSEFNEKGSALLRMAISAPQEYDARVFSRMADALHHSDERMRNLAIWATSYAPWPEYKKLLRDVRDTDTSAYIRERASKMLESFDVAGVY